jgi:Flp pilus assembly pilin Flp
VGGWAVSRVNLPPKTRNSAASLVYRLPSGTAVALPARRVRRRSHAHASGPGRGGASGLFPNFSFREEFRHDGEFWVVRGVGVKERVEMRSLITRLLRDDEGQDLVEYVLLVSLIALAVAAAFPPVTNAIIGVFNAVGTTIGAGAAP